MPTSKDIIKMGITVSSASVTRAGFDSMLLVGDETMVDPTATGPSGTGTFDSFAGTTADLASSNFEWVSDNRQNQTFYMKSDQVDVYG